MANESSTRGVATAYSFSHAIQARTIAPNEQGSDISPPPRPSTSRLESSHGERPFCVEQFVEEADSKSQDETVLYLAYGSNFSAEKFRKDRGIKPLSQVVVQVPSLRLTFDLPGIPYTEPCFANTARRDPKNDIPEADIANSNEKTALLPAKKGDKRWHKGLIGVVYEVTPKDYAHIIATEGGGAGYQDILVDCYPLESSDPNEPVPQNPTTPVFKAHTLFAPAIPDEGEPPVGGHLSRPDPEYAQASARYLKLITDGAAECGLPYEYQKYLLSLQPFTITSTKQRIGQFVFLGTWVPLVLMVFAMNKLFVDKNGKLPKWMARFMNAMFRAVWASYDNFFKPIFGEGERTVENGDRRNNSDSNRPMQDIEKGATQ